MALEPTILSLHLSCSNVPKFSLEHEEHFAHMQRFTDTTKQTQTRIRPNRIEVQGNTNTNAGLGHPSKHQKKNQVERSRSDIFSKNCFVHDNKRAIPRWPWAFRSNGVKTSFGARITLNISHQHHLVTNITLVINWMLYLFMKEEYLKSWYGLISHICSSWAEFLSHFCVSLCHTPDFWLLQILVRLEAPMLLPMV